MHADYRDIRSRITEAPTWFDQDGVPRYGAFHPEMCPNIYASEVALLEIVCHACQERFHVEMHVDDYQRFTKRGGQTLAGEIQTGGIHYGDPPRHQSSCSGETMNCEDIRILGYWRREHLEWMRDASLEIVLPDGKLPPAPEPQPRRAEGSE